MQLFDQDEQILCFFRVPSTDEAERHRDLDWNSYPPSVTTSEIPPMREESKATGVGFIVSEGCRRASVRQKQFSLREELIGFLELTRVYRVWCTSILHEANGEFHANHSNEQQRGGEETRRWKRIWNARVGYKRDSRRDTQPHRSEIDVLLSFG